MITAVTLGGLLITTAARADDGCGVKLSQCDFALSAAEAEITARKHQYDVLHEYVSKVEAQRDKAYERAGGESVGLPWYVWTLVGATAATVFIRGIK